MILIIKVLKGGECEIEVSENDTILTLKHKIEKELNIPVAHQKLLFTGRTLVNDKSIGSYRTTIKNGSRLTLVVKEPEPLKDTMSRIFKHYYTEQQSEEMAKEVVLECEKRINQLSLEDIERIAKYYLDRDRQLYGEIQSS